MIIYVKNNDIVDNTWVGKLITPGSYYLISGTALPKWRSNSQLLTDICGGKAVIAKSSDGLNDIADQSDAIDFLKDLGDIRKTQNIIDTDIKSFRPWGFNFVANFGVSTVVDHLMPEALAMRGGVLETTGGVFGDNVSAQIVDVDNILGAYAGYVVNDFVDKWQVSKTGIDQIISESVSSVLPPGLYFRVTYNSVGLTDNINCAITIKGYSYA